MPIINDPSNLVLTTDIVVDTTTKTIEILTTGAVTNAGATGGVTGQALYSWLKEQWKTNTTFIKYPFPMEAITPEQFEFINGWLPKNDTTRKLIRTAGWAEKSSAGAVLRRYKGVVSLGSIGVTDQPYYQFGTGVSVNHTYQGPVNEAVQIFGDATNGNIDYSTTAFNLFCREQGKTYSASNNTAIGAPTLTYIVYRYPLSNGADLKIAASDAAISTTAPWNQIDITYYAADQLFDVDGDAATEPYRIIITDASGGATTQEIYEKIQWSLRQDADIDAGVGTVTGKTAQSLLNFVGDTLVGSVSVRINNLNSNFLNSVEFYDHNGVKRVYPFISAGTINFGANAGNGDFKYWMFFDSTPAGNFGEATAIVVNDKDGNPVSGTYTGSSISFSFAYDANTQGTRTTATNAAVKVVGIGLLGGQYVVVDHIITRTQGQSILLAPAQERNYANP